MRRIRMGRTARQTNCLALGSTQWLVDIDPPVKGTDVRGKASDGCQQGARHFQSPAPVATRRPAACTERWGYEVKKSRVVVLFGDSLFIDSIEASLQGRRDLGLVRIQSSVNDVVEKLKVLGPDLIIFDSMDSRIQFVVPFLRDRPDIPLLCLDVDTSRVIVVSGEHHLAPSARDLANLIELQTNHHEVALAA